MGLLGVTLFRNEKDLGEIHKIKKGSQKDPARVLSRQNNKGEAAAIGGRS